MTEQVCENCGRSNADRPAIFRNERFCSDLCAKAIGVKK